MEERLHIDSSARLVRFTFDEEAGVYVAWSDDIPGLFVEAPTYRALKQTTIGLARDLARDTYAQEAVLCFVDSGEQARSRALHG